MAMRHVCFWQHQSSSEKIMGIKETPHGVYFICGKSKLLGNKMILSQLLIVCCPNWTPKKVTVKHCGNKEEQPFSISCFTEKSVGYARSVGRRWVPWHCRGTLGDSPDSQLFLWLLKYFGSHLLALPAYSVNIISFLDLWEGWRLDSYSYCFPCLWASEKKLDKDV